MNIEFRKNSPPNLMEVVSDSQTTCHGHVTPQFLFEVSEFCSVIILLTNNPHFMPSDLLSMAGLDFISRAHGGILCPRFKASLIENR